MYTYIGLIELDLAGQGLIWKVNSIENMQVLTLVLFMNSYLLVWCKNHSEFCNPFERLVEKDYWNK